MSKIIIKFNDLKQEQERVKGVLNNLKFYKKNNYQINLPPDINNLTKKEVNKKVAAEYDPDKYQDKINKLKSDWKNMEADFFIKAEKILKIKPLPLYKCFVSIYGTGGSYNPPNIVIMNINSQNFGIFTIPHEVIHLLIHRLIEKHKVTHWTKERLVDLYLSEILNRKILQTIADKVSVAKADEVYEKFVAKGAESVITNIIK